MRIQSLISALVISGGLFAAPAAVAQNVSPEPMLSMNLDSDPVLPSVPKKPVMFDLTSIDKTADPCKDFYQYACGNWMKNNPIPASETNWGSFNTLGEQNQFLLWKELDAASKAPKTPLQVKYGNYYASCMNTDLVDQLGTKPIQGELAMIAGLKDKNKIAQLDVEMQKKYGFGAMLGVAVGQDQKDSSQQILQTGQGGLTLPDRDYYLTQDERSAKIREQYVAHLAAMFTLLDGNGDKAAAEAADVMRIETAIAKGSMGRVEMRDPANRYHMMTVEELQALSPDFDWHLYLTGIGVGQAKTLNVSSPGFVKTVNAEIDTESLGALQHLAQADYR